MKTLILTAIRCSLILLLPAGAYAISAQWDLDPISGDWNTAANWTPTGVPNGAADTATFGLSNTTQVSISEDTEVNGIIFTPAATNPYFITVSSGLTLTLSGTGITNNSGVTQTFGFLEAQMRFTNSSTAGNVSISLFDSSTAFFNSSTAGNSTIEADFGSVSFADHSTAGTATILIHDSSILQFDDHSSAGSAFLGSAGDISFYDSSTAGSAFVSGGFISFFGSSRGDTAQIELLSDPAFSIFGILDISGHNAPGLRIGSLAGNEGTIVLLGANNLTIGSNNLSTTFAGVIQDGGAGGSLTKIGTGTLTLTGANTYIGNTNINRGVLQVDGSITSNTFVNRGGTLAGIGTIDGNLTNNGKVSPGSAGAPGMLTVVHNYTQAQYATLMIQIAGTNTGDFSVLDVLGTANLSGRLDPDLLNGFVPTVGETFTFLNYGAVNGTLSIFNPNIDNLPEHWEISYFPTFAVLTVVAGNVPIPDQGSTFLLLTLGLLGLVTYRRQLLSGRP